MHRATGSVQQVQQMMGGDWMNKGLRESITKSAGDSSFLDEDLREAHRKACDDHPILAILLRELLGDAARIKTRLEELETVVQEVKFNEPNCIGPETGCPF